MTVSDTTGASSIAPGPEQPSEPGIPVPEEPDPPQPTEPTVPLDTTSGAMS